ncbi:cathepsin B-like cysteine proteinase 3 [Brevipalpus obovatus]|uniref:cathepsin B-like cysteine proteinase 3 n=1 Tax=Brevipalpus obovatus TaxID=246614 RepID=UPI003D9E9C59
MIILVQLSLAALLLINGGRCNLNGLDPLSDQMIDKINSLDTTWKAGRNFHPSQLNYVKSLLSVKQAERDEKPIPRSAEISESIPETFDARKKWPECEPIISLIRDQSNCAAGWAFAAASTMSDRYCIDYLGTQKANFSAQDLIACSGLGGCDVAPRIFDAWDYMVWKGIVTGDLYEGGGCMPFSIEPGHHGEKPAPTPSCNKVCQPGYPKSYLQDKLRGQSAMGISPYTKTIQTEILWNGPVQAGFDVYADFLSYKSGVYKVESKDKIGYHSAKLIGWGTEDGVPYWLAANSWGTSWGDGGFFKIRRGFNESHIECNVVSGSF